MTTFMTALDTNILVTLWAADAPGAQRVSIALKTARMQGGLVVAAPVIAELMAAPGRSETFIDHFLRDADIRAEWDLGERIWRLAGRAFQLSAEERRMRRQPPPRRILADFLIGAHAQEGGHRLLTLDDRFYRKAFHKLAVISA